MFFPRSVRPVSVPNKEGNVKKGLSQAFVLTTLHFAPRGPATADVGTMVLDLSSYLTDVINRAQIGVD